VIALGTRTLGFGMKESEGIPLGTVVAGRYRVRERLGEGGMGSVYKVEHVHTGQELALKVLNPKMVKDQIALERFRRESRAPARIQSDHVVQVTDADVAPELGGIPFLVMELLRGKSFDQLLVDEPRLPISDVLTYLAQIARALDKAHGLGIVHRDIKPENLFLTERDDGTPCVKLLDFGIARLTEAADGPTASKTATGAIFGTPLYMAPEQILGQPDRISGRTDIWALGVMAHKMLTGQEPWTANTLPHLVAQIAYEPLPVPSERGSTHSRAFDTWFARCCAREPENRFATASEAVAELADALGADVQLSASQPRFSAALASARSHSTGATALAATAAAGAPALGSDTLSAQVTVGERSGRVVVVAVGIGVLGLLAGGIWLATRGAEAKREVPTPVSAQPTAAPAASLPTAVPTVEPTAAPPASESEPEAAPSASAATPRHPVRPVHTATPAKTAPSKEPGVNPLDQGRK
jgi:tRNA A-37 threonylcarbamoyl transferase component Bud32